jgi:hypothetical protein
MTITSEQRLLLLQYLDAYSKNKRSIPLELKKAEENYLESLTETDVLQGLRNFDVAFKANREAIPPDLIILKRVWTWTDRTKTSVKKKKRYNSGNFNNPVKQRVFSSRRGLRIDSAALEVWHSLPLQHRSPLINLYIETLHDQKVLPVIPRQVKIKGQKKEPLTVRLTDQNIEILASIRSTIPTSKIVSNYLAEVIPEILKQKNIDPITLILNLNDKKKALYNLTTNEFWDLLQPILTFYQIEEIKF